VSMGLPRRANMFTFPLARTEGRSVRRQFEKSAKERRSIWLTNHSTRHNGRNSLMRPRSKPRKPDVQRRRRVCNRSSLTGIW